MPIDIEKERTFLQQQGDRLGRYLSDALGKIVSGVNNLGQNLATDSTSTLPPPPQIQQLTVKTNGNGFVHAVITDNNPIQKHINYFIEMDTNPNFTQPHVFHLGASRSMPPMQLPANDDNGNPQSFYFRANSSYLGGHANEPVHFGGTTPTAVNPGGSQNMTLVPSTGAGTAQASGEQGGKGFGPVIFRPAIGPKRKSA